jgi:hypothetical protein
MPMIIFLTEDFAELSIIFSIAQIEDSPPSMENLLAPGNLLCKNCSNLSLRIISLKIFFFSSLEIGVKTSFSS